MKTNYKHFNINETVKVKLTEHGRKFHWTNHLDFWSHDLPNHPYRPPVEDAEGFSEWQIWSLAEKFGGNLDGVFEGGNVCFPDWEKPSNEELRAIAENYSELLSIVEELAFKKTWSDADGDWVYWVGPALFDRAESVVKKIKEGKQCQSQPN